MRLIHAQPEVPLPFAGIMMTFIASVGDEENTRQNEGVGPGPNALTKGRLHQLLSSFRSPLTV